MSRFTAWSEKRARGAWRAAGRTYGLLGAYHRYRVNRPLAQKIELGCLAYLVLWVPFVIPFLVYSYILLATAAVAAYACLVSVAWGLGLGVDRLRRRFARGR